MNRVVLTAILAASLAAPSAAQPWRDLFNGKDLEGWEVRGDGIWTVVEGEIVGQRKPTRPNHFEFPIDRKAFASWLFTQAWLYTKDEFEEYDLHIEWWVPAGGNSGISIRDQTRAEHAIKTPANFRKTPSKVAYEVQINNGYPDKTPSGSIYALADAKTGAQRMNEWNAFDIESRRDGIRVRMNGELVAEHPGDPQRPKAGPIGLQLHDQHSVAKFRNIRIRVIR